MADPVQVAVAADGTLVYRIDHAPCELPPVRGRDILAAWDGASEAARYALWGARRAFLFDAPDGRRLSLAVTDEGARCWAGAADRLIAIHTSYGLSVFLRLLALIDMLAQCAGGISGNPRHVTDQHPGLLRLAAEARLTDDAGFEESWFVPCFKGMSTMNRPTGAPP